MKKPFKLNAYYLINMNKVEHCDALADLGIKPEGKAVVFLDGSKYCIDVLFGDIEVQGQAKLLLANHERKSCKRCDNAFVAGVTYIDSDGVEYLCKRDDHGFLVLGYPYPEDTSTISCDNYSPKEFTPKVGMIN